MKTALSYPGVWQWMHIALSPHIVVTEFYELMSQMDICLPAFAENGYFQAQASSTFAMAVECNVCDFHTNSSHRLHFL